MHALPMMTAYRSAPAGARSSVVASRTTVAEYPAASRACFTRKGSGRLPVSGIGVHDVSELAGAVGTQSRRRVDMAAETTRQIFGWSPVADWYSTVLSGIRRAMSCMRRRQNVGAPAQANARTEVVGCGGC